MDLSALDSPDHSIPKTRPLSPLSRSKAIREIPYKELAISMLEPSGNSILLKKKERRRRHTTPVKGNILRFVPNNFYNMIRTRSHTEKRSQSYIFRRHHPNTVANGLPRRRVTQAITAEEKENVMKRRSHSVEDLEESTGDSADDILDGRKQPARKLASEQ